jgi:hypothetical protein
MVRIAPDETTIARIRKRNLIVRSSQIPTTTTLNAEPDNTAAEADLTRVCTAGQAPPLDSIRRR